MLALAIVVLFGQASAATVLDEVQKRYAATDHMTAVFVQKVDNGFGKPKDSSGKVYLAKPGKMRWDYNDRKGKPLPKKSFISNGKDLFVVEHDKKQVMKKNITNELLPVAVTFLTGKGKLASEFNAKIATSGKDEVVLQLTPKRPSVQYKSLQLVVAKDDYRVKRSVITDANNNTNEFSFYAPDLKTPVAASWFEFDPGRLKTYQLIDAH